MTNSLKQALTDAGMNRDDYALGAAVIEYRKTGGSLDKALEIVRQAFARKLPSADHRPDAGSGLFRGVGARQPVEDARGQPGNASDGHDHIASPSSSRRGGGGQLMGYPSKRSQGRVASSVRVPSPSYQSASVSVARVAAVTIMDTYRIDGRSIGDYSIGEARKLGNQKTREGYILKAASSLVSNVKGNELLRNIVKAGEMQKIIQKAAEVADAH